MVGPWLLFAPEIVVDDEVTSTVSLPLFIGDMDDGATTPPIGSLSLKYDEEEDTVFMINGLTSSGTITLRNTFDNSFIQTSVGKKLQVLLLWANPTGLAPTFNIRASDTVNTADGAIVASGVGIGSNGRGTVIPMVEIPANKFLTLEVTANTTQIVYGVMVEKAV